MYLVHEDIQLVENGFFHQGVGDRMYRTRIDFRVPSDAYYVIVVRTRFSFDLPVLINLLQWPQ